MTDEELDRIPGRAKAARDAHPHSATVAVLAGDIGVLVAEVRRLRAEASYQVAVEWRRKCEALEQFKAYVHSRLDAAGVPADLEVQHLRALDAAARKELERFAARVAELEAALRPFAEGAVVCGFFKDSVTVDGLNTGVLVGDCRRAAALLKGDAP